MSFVTRLNSIINMFSLKYMVLFSFLATMIHSETVKYSKTIPISEILLFMTIDTNFKKIIMYYDFRF